MLYVVAAICFIITGLAFVSAISPFERNLSIVSSVILGLFFAGLGVTQRPRTTSLPIEVPARSVQPLSAATAIMESEKAPTSPVIGETQPLIAGAEVSVPIEPIVLTEPAIQLTDVKGIGVKRMEQLKALGIGSVDDLSRASVNDLAKQLKLSPKITAQWVDAAKTLVQKPEN
jgi:predicted flap endonuclease-1-like 5' DNA nuclease